MKSHLHTQWAKIIRFEYWNWLLFYSPIIPFWLWFSLRNRCLTYFSAVNPALPFGGFLKEDKESVNMLLPKYLLPKSRFVLNGTSWEEIGLDIDFPVIAKPNSGQRGRNVKILRAQPDLIRYHRQANESYLLQEFLEYPYEFAVFYSKLPGRQKGLVSSVTQKVFLSVTGDGKRNIRQLMEQDIRTQMQIESLPTRNHVNLEEVLPLGKKYILEPIGNHCRGTTFVSANHLIDDRVHRVFDEIMNRVDGFYFGRFDLKAESIESLYTGKGLKIMELNGITSDPAHIFDPNYKLLSAYRDVLWHWSRMSKIARANLKRGVKPLKVKEAWGIIVEKFSKPKTESPETINKQNKELIPSI